MKMVFFFCSFAQFICTLASQQAKLNRCALLEEEKTATQWIEICVHQRISELPSRIANWRSSYLRHLFQRILFALPCKRHHQIDLKFSRDDFLMNFVLFLLTIFSSSLNQRAIIFEKNHQPNKTKKTNWIQILHMIVGWI